MDISGQAAIVSGAASGLGAATARALAAAGAKVAVLDVNEQAALKVANAIGGLVAPCDVASSEEVTATLRSAASVHGPARILVNCAGIGPAKRIVGRDGPAPLSEFERPEVRQPRFGGPFGRKETKPQRQRQLDLAPTARRALWQRLQQA